MDRSDELKTKEFAEATVMALFRSAVAAFYVDVQHDWFRCVRWSSKIPMEFPADGLYSTAIATSITSMIPDSHRADLQLKISCEYIRNHVNKETPEFGIKVPVRVRSSERWLHFFVTLIDMECGMPHHVVLSARDITREHLAEQKRYELISQLRNETSQQDRAIEQQNRELFAQNQELSALNKELLESQDALFQLADDMQEYMFQNSMYQEMLKMQQAGIIAYKCDTLEILYMNDTAMELYEISHDSGYKGLTIEELRRRVVITDGTEPVRNMPILQNVGKTADLECSITHADGSVHHMAISSKNILLENGENIIIDVVSDVTARVLMNQQLETACYIATNERDSAQNVLMHFSDYIYHVDLTTGMLLDQFTCSSDLKPLQAASRDIPCNYDEFISNAIDLLGLEFISSNGKSGMNWTCRNLLKDFYFGISNCEAEFWHKSSDTYHRITGLIAVDPQTCHVIMTVIGNDITMQRKQEYEEQRLLKEAQSAAEQSAAMLEEKQAELESKHKELETAYGELVEFKSIVQGMQSIFDSCYYLDLTSDKFLEIKGNRAMRKVFTSGRSAREAMLAYIRSDAHPDYWRSLFEFSDLNTLTQRIKDKPYITIEYESRTMGWIRGYLVPAQYNQDSEPTHFLYVCEIIDEEKRMQNHLQKIAETDGLTGIDNRASGERKISAYIQNRHPGAFGVLDCDDFKGINDNYGHGIGDKVLITVANSLKEAFGSRNVVLRLGGDEFAFYLLNCTTTTMLTSMVSKFFTILDTVQIPQMKGRRISVSVGAAIYKGHSGACFHELYEAADQRLYESKRFSGNRLTL